MKYVYPAILTQEDDGIIVSFPDVEGARADGATMEEALENADDVLTLMLLTMEEKHMDTKPPTPDCIARCAERLNGCAHPLGYVRIQQES